VSSGSTAVAGVLVGAPRGPHERRSGRDLWRLLAGHDVEGEGLFVEGAGGIGDAHGDGRGARSAGPRRPGDEPCLRIDRHSGGAVGQREGEEVRVRVRGEDRIQVVLTLLRGRLGGAVDLWSVVVRGGTAADSPCRARPRGGARARRPGAGACVPAASSVSGVSGASAFSGVSGVARRPRGAGVGGAARDLGSVAASSEEDGDGAEESDGGKGGSGHHGVTPDVGATREAWRGRPPSSRVEASRTFCEEPVGHGATGHGRPQ
jgi:hypothetical protein